MRRIDLGERPTSRGELAGWYAAVLEAQAQSGLSVADYATKIGVSVPTLYQWRRRLTWSGSKDGDADPANLVEVTLARPSRSNDSGCLIVRVHDGRRCIEVPRGFDHDDLRRLVAALESC